VGCTQCLGWIARVFYTERLTLATIPVILPGRLAAFGLEIKAHVLLRPFQLFCVFVLFFQKFLLRSFICFLTPGSPQARGHLGASGNKERISRELKNAERGIRWSECIFADRTKDSGRAEKSRVALSR